ncbi:MAG: hypothetical protein K9N55_09115 [Phycisphaerae bacterium]|nr:hypothetical protein [Phycisphaerae bacterium]
MNDINALSRRLYAFLCTVFLLAAVFGLASCKNESPQSSSSVEASKTDAKQESVQSPTLSSLTYTNDSAPFDYQKRMLAEGRSIQQYEYVLFEAGSIPVDSQGNMAFSGTGPGFTLNNQNSTGTTVTVEKPMQVKIVGAIDLDKYSLAVAEGKNSTTVIGKATYQHSLEGSRKVTFSRGDFEMSEYKQDVERELDILYIANPARIKLSSGGPFEVQKIGTGITSYSGQEETSEYRSSDNMTLYLEFSVH